jgi:signal transduction histidine kinase
MIPWSDTTRRRIGYAIVAMAVALAAFEFSVAISDGDVSRSVRTAILLVAFGSVAALAVRAVPRNGAVWALIWWGFFGALGSAADSFATIRNGFDGADVEAGLISVAPSQLDLLGAIVVSIGLWAWLPSVFILTNHLLIVFPSGSAVSSRWRRTAWISSLLMAAFCISTALITAPWVDTPYDELYESDQGGAGIFSWAVLPLMLIAAAALIHLVIRFKRSVGDERLQYRWVTWALSVQVIWLFSFGLLPDLISGIVADFSLVFVPVAFGIAITKYRLYEIDLVVNRSLVFGGLAVFITVIYAGLVVGIGSVVGGSSFGWSVAATALVAVAFEPVRSRLQGWVNRLVYGHRATPYEVLSDLTGRLAATESEEGLLDRMALRLAEGTGAEQAAVWVTGGTGFRAVASEPVATFGEGGLSLEDLPGATVPIEHDNEILGALTVEKRRGETLTYTETRLVEDLAGSAGILLRRLRLDAELRAKAEELAESRRRLVDAQDVERRRLERQLDEGPQRRMHALKRKLGLASEAAKREGSEQTQALANQLTNDAQAAIDNIRALAHGIYPPLLEGDGIEAAVRSLADVAPIDVHVDARIESRRPLAEEAALYFCISEALTNAAKHAHAPVTVELSDVDGTRRFTVTDSGPGFDQTSVERGAGLANMADRLNILGGTITISSQPGGNTTITGTLPTTVPTPA